MKIILILLFSSFSFAYSLEDKVNLDESLKIDSSGNDQSKFVSEEQMSQAERKKALEDQSEELDKILIEDKLETELDSREFVFGPLEALYEKEPDLFEGLDLEGLEIFGSRIFKI